MKKIPFTIKIRNKLYNGYLMANDFLQPPKNYFVFMENHMVGELICRQNWTFTQGRWYKILGKLNNNDCNEIAEYLGNVADLLYKGKKKYL
jgi:hypothetical protein